MQFWKPLLIIVPAGLILGVIGGHYTRPVLKQRGDGSSPLQKFGVHASTGDAGVQPAFSNGIPDVPPNFAGDPARQPGVTEDDRAITGWHGPDFARFPDYKPAPLPTIDQLKAEIDSREAALGKRADAGARPGETAVDAAGDAAVRAADAADSADPEDGPPAASDGQAGAGRPKIVTIVPSTSRSTISREPRTADGKLPAIW